MNFITNLLTMQNQFKVYHWQTQKKPGSYAQHIAFGTAYDELTPLIDDFVEIFQGKRGVLMGRDGFTINLQNLDDTPNVFIDEFVNYLTQSVPQALDSTADTDLLNIRDEMLAILNQTKYRLMLK
jgi:DNA-binding ferritin-like protein